MNKYNNVSPTAAGMIFRVQALNRAPRRGHRRIHPPLKNCIYTVGVKSISKMSFLRSMGSTKKCFLRSMGSTFLSFATPPQLNDYFLGGIVSAEGCQKWQNVIPTLHEKQKKKKLLTKHGKQICHFCNPSRMILTFLPELVRFWPVLAGSGRFWPALAGSGRFSSGFGPKWSDLTPPNTRRGPG